MFKKKIGGTKNIGTVLVFVLIILLLCSCVSMQDRISRGDEVLETIQVTFTSYQPLQFIVFNEKIKEKAYSMLLEQAEQKYQGKIDIVNIKIEGGFSWWNVLTMSTGIFVGGFIGGVVNEQQNPQPYDPVTGYAKSWEGDSGIPQIPIGLALGGFLSGHFQKITATGDIVATGEYRALSQSTRNRSNTRMTPLQGAIHKTSDAITLSLPNGSIIALLNIESSDKNIAEEVIDEMEYIFVSSGNFTMVNRRTLDTIMAEQNFQMSGNVDDSEAVSIGKMTGANIVITGSVSGTDSSRRLTLRALDVETGRIITMAREEFRK